MADPTPATSAIVAAFNDRYELCGPFDDNWQELCIAAALRAVADQVLIRPGIPRSEYSTLMQIIDGQFRAIAAELEGCDA